VPFTLQKNEQGETEAWEVFERVIRAVSKPNNPKRICCTVGITCFHITWVVC